MKKSTRTNLLIALAYSVTLTVGMFLGYKFLKDQGYKVNKEIVFTDSNAEKRAEIMHIIDKNYVDAVNSDSLKALPIDSMLHSLDPHSSYLPPRKAFEFSETLDGNFEGIGVQYYIFNDSLLVTGVVKGGPAFEAGIKLGDRIIKIDSNVVSGRKLPQEKMIGKIKGKSGTTVKLQLKRHGLPEPFLIYVKRGRVAVSSIDAAYMIAPETGYIRVSKFGANTGEDFTNALRMLKSRGLKKLVLDLRDNGGGYLNSATELANQLFPENKLIVYTEGKHEPRTDYVSLGGGEFEEGKLAVLINEYSASASEIVAGAVQDQGRGIIVGRRSFGKGLVQEQFPFGDGSALNLTIARYYTPSGRSIQKPYKKGFTAYQRELEDRMQDGELTSKDKAERDTTDRKTFTTANGKKVYAGGGILPDVYVKLDTSGFTRLYDNLLTKRVIFDYVFDVLANRYTVQYLEQNINEFALSEADFKDFVTYVEKRKIVINPKQLAASKPIIVNDLRVLLYKYYLGDAGYYKAQNVTDMMVKSAVSSLQ